MRKLIMGIVEFREKMLPQYAEQFSKLALAQTPDALSSSHARTAGLRQTCSYLLIRAIYSRCATSVT
ncbi:hypothetical protein OKW30_007315 [Paraburkholderia sp. Clong3]